MEPVFSYNEGRQHIQDGDIVFVSKRKTFLASTIRFFTRSNYSHAGIAFWMTTANQRRLMMVEAQGGSKRRILNISYYDNVDLDVVKAPKEWTEISEDALARIGKVKYGWLEAGYVGLREFLLKYTRRIKLPTLNLPGEICSEYIANVYDLPEKHISPQLLWETLEDEGHEVRLRIR